MASSFPRLVPRNLTGSIALGSRLRAQALGIRRTRVPCPCEVLAPCTSIARFRVEMAGPARVRASPRGPIALGPLPEADNRSPRRGHHGRRDPRRDHRQPTRVRCASSKTRISSGGGTASAGAKSKRRRYSLGLGGTPGKTSLPPAVIARGLARALAGTPTRPIARRIWIWRSIATPSSSWLPPARSGSRRADRTGRCTRPSSGSSWMARTCSSGHGSAHGPAGTARPSPIRLSPSSPGIAASPAMAADATDPDSIRRCSDGFLDQVPEVEIGPEHGRRGHPRHDPASRAVIGESRQAAAGV